MTRPYHKRRIRTKHRTTTPLGKREYQRKYMQIKRQKQKKKA